MRAAFISLIVAFATPAPFAEEEPTLEPKVFETIRSKDGKVTLNFAEADGTTTSVNRRRRGSFLTVSGASSRRQRPTFLGGESPKTVATSP
jgi:hypothetical protein